jgi:putative glutamine amidotransferase
MINDLHTLIALLSRVDGLLLAGGTDVHPSRYGEEAHPLTEEADLELDEFEITITSWAFREDIPVLGVCRGMQLINVVLGGTLYQDISDQYPNSIGHTNRHAPRTHLAHHINVEPGSRMETILGTEKVWVNSLHHQAIKDPGKGVRITGRAPDGVPELLEVPGYRFVMAVQSHPEEIYAIEPAFERLFSAFVQASSTRLDTEIPVEYSIARREITAGAGQ